LCFQIRGVIHTESSGNGSRLCRLQIIPVPPSTNETLLRRSFDVALRARTNGDHPFGAILVGPDGTILMEQANGFSTRRRRHDRSCRTPAREPRPRAPMMPASSPAARSTVRRNPGANVRGCALLGRHRPRRLRTERKSLKAMTGAHSENPTLDLACRIVFAAGNDRSKCRATARGGSRRIAARILVGAALKPQRQIGAPGQISRRFRFPGVRLRVETMRTGKTPARARPGIGSSGQLTFDALHKPLQARQCRLVHDLSGRQFRRAALIDQGPNKDFLLARGNIVDRRLGQYLHVVGHVGEGRHFQEAGNRSHPRCRRSPSCRPRPPGSA